MKNNTFSSSIKCAFNGLTYGLKTEKNFKYYFIILFIFLIINLYFNVGLYGHIVFCITCGGVFCSELLNTAIEHLSNYISTDFENELKLAKDIAASAVLVCGIVFFICEVLIIGNCIL